MKHAEPDLVSLVPTDLLCRCLKWNKIEEVAPLKHGNDNNDNQTENSMKLKVDTKQSTQGVHAAE